MFGFLGPNGAGKTTTLKLLMQLVFPTSGRARDPGRPVGDVGVRRRIGYLPENPYFYDYLTAEELLDYFAALFGYAAAERRARVRALLDEVGHRRRAAAAAAQILEGHAAARRDRTGAHQRAGLVFLDEPMSGLDPLGRRDVRGADTQAADKGCTVFFSSHVLSDAEALCSRVAILAGGRLVADGQLWRCWLATSAAGRWSSRMRRRRCSPTRGRACTRRGADHRRRIVRAELPHVPAA